MLAGGMKVSPQAPMANPQPLPWNTLLQHFGVSVRGDMAYDLVANEAIPVPSDFGRVMQVYPFFIRAESSRLSPVNKDIGAVVLTWASTIDTTKAAKGTVTPLLATSRGAGNLYQRDFHRSPERLSQDRSRPQAAGGARVTQGQRQGSGQRGRAVVVGSSDFATDRFVQFAPENLGLALNAVDWLAQDEELIAIRSKDRQPVPLVFKSAAERDVAKYANLIGLPLVVALLGLAHLIQRRRRTRDPYRPLIPAGEAAT